VFELNDSSIFSFINLMNTTPKKKTYEILFLLIVMLSDSMINLYILNIKDA